MKSMSEDDFTLLKTHLKKATDKPIACPVCGSTSWSAEGPHDLVAPVPDKPGTATMIPVVYLTCNKCSCMLQFAWMLINPKHHVP